jgi:hypothetical protein
MEFGSEYVYKYEHSSDESISDDDDDLKSNETGLFCIAASSKL